MIFNSVVSRNSSGGSSGSGQITQAPDPNVVYKETRPSDWLPMPTPADNEMYLLVLIPDGGSSLLAFSVACTGNYTVEIGTVNNGAFVDYSSEVVASGSSYMGNLLSDNYGNLTSDGMKQAMVKVSGTDIVTWAVSTHEKATFRRNWDIVEISCRLPNCESISLLYGSSMEGALSHLQYFSWYGDNNATNMDGMFQNCSSLKAVLSLDTSKVTTMYGMFSSCYSMTAIPSLNISNVETTSTMFKNCYSLTSIPALDTSKVTTMNSMFYNCYSLTSIPTLDTSKVSNMSYMFYNCYSLTLIPALNTSKVTNMSYMFYNCYSLTSIPTLDTSKVTNMSYMFAYCHTLKSVPYMDTSAVTTFKYMFYACYSLISTAKLSTANLSDASNCFTSCYSLGAITLDPNIATTDGCNISLYRCSLSHAAIITLFNSLPTNYSSKKITLTDNPGISELTDGEIAIATNKNWTVTI